MSESSSRSFTPMLMVLILVFVGVAGWLFFSSYEQTGKPVDQSFWTGKKSNIWTGSVVYEKGGFSQMNVQLVNGTPLTFVNSKDKSLNLDIVDWRGKLAAHFHIPPHEKKQWMPKANGVYEYYDAKTTSFGSVTIPGSDGEKVYQVVSKSHSPAFPAPDYGVIAVTDAQGGGIPLSSSYGSHEVPGESSLTGKHYRKWMKNTPWMEVPGGTMTFKPWVIVVKAGTPIQLYDEDGMNHAFYPGVFPVMYDNHGQIEFYHDSFKGILLKKNGGHAQIVLDRPGLYHILCTIHSYAWHHTYRSHHFYGGYPYIMDAVVIVEPTSQSGA